MKTGAKKSPPSPASTALKKLASRIATAHRETAATKSVAKAAKADYKRARKTYKHARQLAKTSRKALKALKEELLALKGKMALAARTRTKPKVVKTPAKKAIPAPPPLSLPAPVVPDTAGALPPVIEPPAPDHSPPPATT